MKIARALTIFGIFIVSVTSFAEVRPSIRVLTFTANDPWQAVQTLLVPEGLSRYRTEDVGAAFKVSNKPCEDMLSVYQERPLKVMLDNKYITKELYEELSNPRHRAHDMRQYVLITLFEDMTRDQAQARGFGHDRFLDEPGEQGKVRVHMGAMYAVRGYDLDRAGADNFKILRRKLPFEAEGLPAPLDRVLERTHLPMTVEIGRALSEKGSDRKTFALLMQIMTGVLANDAKALGIAPNAFAVFGRADDAAHARLYSHSLGGKPMTPDMQRFLESNPAVALKAFESMPLPTKEQWANYGEGIIVGSLAQLLLKYPEDALSATVAKIRKLWPNADGARLLQLVRELQTFNREDFDLDSHDPQAAGRRAAVRVHDWGTGLLEVRLLRLLKKHGFESSKANVEDILEHLNKDSLNSDPDFGQEGWLERSVYIGVPPDFNPQSGERLPSLTISNLDSKVRNGSVYLAQILLAYTAKLEADLRSMDSEENFFLLANMNETRGKKKMPPAAHVDLRTFLETYDLNVGTSDQRLQTELKILGADMRDGIRFDNPFKGGQVDIKVNENDFAKLGMNMVELMRNPQKLQAAMQTIVMNGLQSLFKPAKLYRFGFAEIAEIRAEHRQFVKLYPGFQARRLMRLYGAFQ